MVVPEFVVGYDESAEGPSRLQQDEIVMGLITDECQAKRLEELKQAQHG